MAISDTCQDNTTSTITPLTQLTNNSMVALTSTSECSLQVVQMALHQPLVQVVLTNDVTVNDVKQQPSSSSTSSSSASSLETAILGTGLSESPQPLISKKRARYSVHFHRQEPLHSHEIPSRAQLHQFWNHLYITKQEQIASQQEMITTLRLYNNAQQQEEQEEGMQLDLEERIRGLEAFLPQDGMRACRMKQAIQLILTRQERQAATTTTGLRLSLLDTTWLETNYRPFSQAASKLAQERGRKDLQAVPASWSGGAPTKSVMMR
jgi:hypothetical protein